MPQHTRRETELGFSEAHAQELAVQLLRVAERWTKGLRVLGCSNETLEESLRREALAYGLCLLDLRLETAESPHAPRFLQAVREECGRLLRPRSGARYSAPGARLLPDGPAKFTEQFPARQPGSKGQFAVTTETFRDFCRETGLGSDVLVGRGANLASLLFYIVVHGQLFASGKTPSEHKRLVLRAARECGAAFQHCLDRSHGVIDYLKRG